MRRGPAALALTFAIAACANTPGGETTSSDAQAIGQRSASVVFVERQNSGENATVTTHVGARFVQYTGLAEDALPDLLGTPHMPGSSGGCAERTEAAVDTESGRAEARLLDVGTIEVRAGDRVLNLEPRRFPDLWNVVSGVIYASDGDLAAESWHFTAPGGAQARGFDFDAHAPDDLNGVSVADQPFASGSTIELPRHPYGVRWVRGDHDDSVVITFEPATGSDAVPVIACSARDDGALDVESPWAERIADLTHATIVIHRIRARAMPGASADGASVVFDSSVRGHAG